MNATIERINEVGSAFVEFALPMLIQSGVLILILLLVDLLLHKRVRAVFRYWMWMLVLVKLVLPTSLSSPVSVGRWFGDELAYVDTIPAPAPEPKADIVPMPRVEARPIANIPPVETIARAPVVVPVEPTVRNVEPTPRQIESASTVQEPEPVVPLAPPETPLSWQAAVLLVWSAVLSAMLLLLLQRAFFVRRLVGRAADASGKMTDLLTHCRERMAVRRNVGLHISAGATSPAVCGLFRPVILVPKKLTPSLSSAELRVVLLHELAHIKRRDLWVNFAQTLLQIFYFYNPLLWLANVMIRRAREQAVDEMVLVAMGEKARQYPATLVNVAKLALKRPALSLRLIGVVESKGALTGRIKHILGRPMPKTAKLGILGLLAVVIAAAILLPMAKAMKPKPSVVNNGPLDIRLVGVCPDSSDQLYDAAGRKLQTARTLLSPWTTHWKDESQQRDFIFEVPDVNDQLIFLPFPRLSPAGTDRGLGGGFRGYFDPTDNPSTFIQSITFDRTYRRQLFYLQLKEQIRHIDLTLRYFYGSRRQADCTFTGPFAMGQTVEADGAKPYYLTFQKAFTSDQSGIQLRFQTEEPFDSDTPAVLYDLSGRRYMLNSHSGRSGSSGADRKYQGVVVSPDEIAAITFGEKPHEITFKNVFKNVAVHFPDRLHRTYPEFLDRMAERLGLTGLSPKQLAQYQFKSPQEAIDVIDIVRGGQHVHHAFEAIKHSRPRVKISGLDQTTQDKIRRVAANWASAGYLRKYGIELGLMGQWPEFFDMAVARLSEEIPTGNYQSDARTWTQDNAGIANVMVNHRMEQLTVEQVNKLKQVIRKTDSGSVLRYLLWYLERTESQPTTDAFWELAQDERPWIWWPATRVWYLRSSRTRAMYDGLSEKMKVRMLLINDRFKDENLEANALMLLKEIFTPQLGEMASQVWNEVRGRISRELDKRSATETYIDYLRRMQSETTVQEWVRGGYSSTWRAAYVIRTLNVWYDLDVANLGKDPDARWSEPRTRDE
ncbi:MAG: M56 family metallopeptidase, partial [Planctomycetota bacterium]